MLWSNEKTCQSQIAQIKKCGIEVVKSEEILEDVDELEDWLRLCKNFGIIWNKNSKIGVADDANNDEKQPEEIKHYEDYRQNFPRVSAILQDCVDT